MQKTTTVAALSALVLSAILALGQPTFAGPKKGGREVGAKRDKVLSQLNLTPAQKAQVKPILKAAREKSKAIRADASLTPEEKKSKTRAVRRDARAQAAALLTPEQREKLRAGRRPSKEKAVKSLKMRRRGV